MTDIEPIFARLVAGDEQFDPKVVPVKVGGRTFGDGRNTRQKFEEPIPKVIVDMMRDLSLMSAILTLKRDASPENIFQERIFHAYKRDLDLLKSASAGFRHTVVSAVRYSIIAPNKEAYEKFLAEALSEVPEAVLNPILSLPAELAVLPTDQLVQGLRDQWASAVERLAREITAALQAFCDRKIVGLIQHVGPTVFKYHYFMRIRQEMVKGKKDVRTRSFDPDAQFGERNVETTTVETTKRVVHAIERHTHHIVGAKEETVADFSQKVPERVAAFLEAVPDWILPYLKIASGMITQEEKVRWTTSDRTEVDTVVLSVWKGSPAVTLGPYVLAGWSDDDLKVGSRYSTVQNCNKVDSSTSTVQKLRDFFFENDQKRDELRKDGKFWLAVGLFVVMVVFFIWATR